MRKSREDGSWHRDLRGQAKSQKTQKPCLAMWFHINLQQLFFKLLVCEYGMIYGFLSHEYSSVISIVYNIRNCTEFSQYLLMAKKGSPKKSPEALDLLKVI